MPSLEEGTSYRKGIKKRSLWCQFMSAGLEGSENFRDLALEAGRSACSKGSREGVAATAETLKAEKQSRGLKQDTQKRGKKGKE